MANANKRDDARPSKRTTRPSPSGDAKKKTAEKTAEKTAKKTAAAARATETAALPVVAIVGTSGAGVTSLARRLAGEARWASGRARCTIDGVELELRDAVGQARDERDDDASGRALDQLLDALQDAAVIVTVIDRSDPDGERLGGRVDRSIYGAWHDRDKPIITVLNKLDRAADERVARRMRDAWPDAIETSATRGDGVEALAGAIARGASGERAVCEDVALVEGTLQALQLALIERTRSRAFDGAKIAATLREWLADGTARAAQFLREGTATYTRSGLDREDDGLRFVGSIEGDLWDADTLHVVTREGARVAKKLRALDAVELEQGDPQVVSARWPMEGLRSIAAPGAPSVQRVQLEFVRRGGSNAFRGDRIARWLLGHPDPWRAVAFGRLRAKLRDRGRVTESFTRFNTVLELADDQWNADHLWIVARDESAAEALRTVAETHWFADTVVTLTEDEARRVCAVEAPARVLELWWD